MIQAAYLRVYLPADRTVRLPDHVAPHRRSVIAASDHFVWGEPATDGTPVADIVWMREAAAAAFL